MEPLNPYANSKRVQSPQQELHPRLTEVVQRHRTSPCNAPIPDHTREAFDRLKSVVGDKPRIILDSGCGTGESTVALADRHPDVWVVGVDKSAERLQRGRRPLVAELKAPGALWLRAEIGAFWKLALEAGWRLERHYLFYPNPWPKKRQLTKRFHGHGCFSFMVRLGGRLELRTNWHIYAHEMQAALQQYGIKAACSKWPGENITRFEQKYRLSGHDLYRLRANLDNASLR